MHGESLAELQPSEFTDVGWEPPKFDFSAEMAVFTPFLAGGSREGSVDVAKSPGK